MRTLIRELSNGQWEVMFYVKGSLTKVRFADSKEEALKLADSF
jgi:hypothetical protein